MYNILKISWIILGTLLMTTGYSEKPKTEAEKLSKIIEVQNYKTIDKKETIEIQGFNIPCYLINTFNGPVIDYKATPYPYLTWFPEGNTLSLALNDRYPENGGETYRLENFFFLKFDKKTVQRLMEKFKTGETQVIDPKDGTYILFSTATDDSRIIVIGSIEDKPTDIKEAQE